MKISVTGPYPLLRAVINSREATISQLAFYAGCTPISLSKKLNGKTGWWLDECLGIKAGLETGEPVERLFKK